VAATGLNHCKLAIAESLTVIIFMLGFYIRNDCRIDSDKENVISSIRPKQHKRNDEIHGNKEKTGIAT
jgi:hypothetical protein